MASPKEKISKDYFVLFRGVTETRTYTNIAIRNWVSHEMRRVLGMEYLTPQDRSKKRAKQKKAFHHIRAEGHTLFVSINT